MYLHFFRSFSKSFKAIIKSIPFSSAICVEIPWIFSELYGMVKLSGFIKKDLLFINLPSLSLICHANWTSLGQFSLSDIGALKFFGNPVVSESKVKYIRNC